MNDQPQSPPKRITRARAAKTNHAGVKATKVAAASTNAKLARSTSISAASKRKTKEDKIQTEEEQDDMDELNEPQPPRTARGRPKKAAVSAGSQQEEDTASVVVKPTRGRPKKNMTDEPAREPAKSTRGRPKKPVASTEDTIVIEAPLKRAVRTRAASVTKATAPRKTVKFEEPDKENIVPPVANANRKANTAAAPTGLRAKPVRKPTVAAARGARGEAKSSKEANEKLSPLSPKKATQMAIAREIASDDELSIDQKTPMKPLMKSPVKPPGSIFSSSKKLDFSAPASGHTGTASATHDAGESIMGSPARRPPPSNFKDALKSSPQKKTLGESVMPSLPAPSTSTNLHKTSLLQSPARRPQSPTKLTETGSPSKAGNPNEAIAATPRGNTFKMSRFATPRTITRSIVRSGQIGPPPSDLPTKDHPTMESRPQPKMKFSGRLSSIVPRTADPAFAASEPAIVAAEGHAVELELAAEPTVVDHTETLVTEAAAIIQDISSPSAPPRYSGGAFGFRGENGDVFQDSDSEDELASVSSKYSSGGLRAFKLPSPNFTSSPSTPTPFAAIPRTPRAAKSQGTPGELRSCGAENIGFTPLAQQLNDWMAPSPDKPTAVTTGSEGPSPSRAVALALPTGSGSASLSPLANNAFFDDEMSVRDELPDEELDVASKGHLPKQDEDGVELSPVKLDEEDLALAHEADELSLLEPDPNEPTEKANDNGGIVEATPSEASQEYGDENDIPTDPALLTHPPPQVPIPPSFATPKRVFSERVCHTVSKVPLKPAAEDFLMRPSPKKRSLSISRLPIKSPSTSLQRNNTVISYSPSKAKLRTPTKGQVQDVADTPSSALTKDDAALWSTLGTPPRTPRRDINTALLSGAVVFVDVHTTEGADASMLFTELLTQMGARCVKTWNWNGSEEDGSKIGITHIVFKDGGRRTLERAREAGGVVSCVGVAWVLDCEREDKWLDESPYAVDTALIPRGGHRRRKSMEPRTLANLNGTLIPASGITPARNSSSEPTRYLYPSETPFVSKSRRRDSVQWVRSPPTESGGEQGANDETPLLSPVPVTPAPEFISAYAEHGLYGDETPSAQTPYFLHKEQLVQKTVPPAKGRFFETEDEHASGQGEGFLSMKKDENVMMRLMAARRKSLQWAPKVGSPLARDAAW